MAIHFLLEFWVGLRLRVSFLQVEDQWHQRLGDKTAAVNAKAPALVGAITECIGLLHGHATSPYVTERTIEVSPSWSGGLESSASAARAARMKARILSESFSPGTRSTPEDTSTPGARVMRSASATLPASSPPESMNGTPAL